MASMLALSNPAVEGEAVNRTVSPPGKTWGQRWVVSPRASLAKGCHELPAAGIRDRGCADPDATVMYPSWPQVAPIVAAPGVPPRVTGVPPWTKTFLSLLSAKKPIHWLSGLKNGSRPFSVPGRSDA